MLLAQRLRCPEPDSSARQRGRAHGRDHRRLEAAGAGRAARPPAQRVWQAAGHPRAAPGEQPTRQPPAYRCTCLTPPCRPARGAIATCWAVCGPSMQSGNRERPPGPSPRRRRPPPPCVRRFWNPRATAAHASLPSPLPALSQPLLPLPKRLHGLGNIPLPAMLAGLAAPAADGERAMQRMPDVASIACNVLRQQHVRYSTLLNCVAFPLALTLSAPLCAPQARRASSSRRPRSSRRRSRSTNSRRRSPAPPSATPPPRRRLASWPAKSALFESVFGRRGCMYCCIAVVAFQPSSQGAAAAAACAASLCKPLC